MVDVDCCFRVGGLLDEILRPHHLYSILNWFVSVMLMLERLFEKAEARARSREGLLAQLDLTFDKKKLCSPRNLKYDINTNNRSMYGG